MGDRPAESVARQVDALFRLGVVTGLSDGRLLERFLAQSDAEGEIAFETIVRRHGPMVLGVCRRVLGHEQAAEDAFQATFMVLALKAGTVRCGSRSAPGFMALPPGSPAERLARSGGNNAILCPRRNRLNTRAVNDPDFADLALVLDEELARLPEKYRRPIVLCFLEGRSQDDAARALGCTKGTVSGRIARGKELLRQRLSRRGLAPTAGLAVAVLTSDTASAAVPASLLVSTVRIATAAAFIGAEAGVTAGSVGVLARGALKWMLLRRLVKAALLFLGVVVTAGAVATPVLLTGNAEQSGVLMGASAPRRGPAAARPSSGSLSPLRDRFGDPLPARALLRLGTIQRRHSSRVIGIDFTGDGRAAVSVQSNGLANFWDAASGRETLALNLTGDAPVEEHIISCSALSPDGRTLMVGGHAIDSVRRRDSPTVWIWDMEHHRLRRRIEVQTLDFYFLAFAPDGNTFATGGLLGDVQLWDVATGARQSAFTLGKTSVYSLAFTPDGKFVTAADQGRGVGIWDLKGNRQTFLDNSRSSNVAPSFSPDGRLMAAVEIGGEIVVSDRTCDRQCYRISGGAAAFAPDSRTIAVARPTDGMLTLVDARTGVERWKAQIGWGSFPAGPAFSPDGKAIIIERGGVLRFFDADSGREQFGNPDAHQGYVTAVQYAPDGRAIFTASDDGTVREWDVRLAPDPCDPAGRPRQPPGGVSGWIEPCVGRAIVRGVHFRLGPGHRSAPAKMVDNRHSRPRRRARVPGRRGSSGYFRTRPRAPGPRCVYRARAGGRAAPVHTDSRSRAL